MFEPFENLDESGPTQEANTETTIPDVSLNGLQTELSKSFYERYFLHYGGKAAATILFMSDLIEAREQGGQNFADVISKFEVGGEPLSFSVKPAIKRLCLSEECLDVTKKYWGEFMKLPADRLTILPSDFISPMGYGVSVEAVKVPPQIFLTSWSLADLVVPEKLGAILQASLALWGRCYQKLESLKNSPDELLPEQRQEVDVINQVMLDVCKGEYKRWVLALGETFFNKIDPSLKSRFERASFSYKAGVDNYRKQEQKITVADKKVKNLDLVLEHPTPVSAESLKTASMPARPEARRVKAATKVHAPAISRPQDLSSPVKKEPRVISKYPLERELADTWTKKGNTIHDLSAKLRVAFQEGNYVVVKLASGFLIEGIPVVGGRRMDFFTVINEETETTVYPKYLDVRRLDIFKFKNQKDQEGSNID
jgi:hypothetical protein